MIKRKDSIEILGLGFKVQRWKYIFGSYQTEEVIGKDMREEMTS